MDSVTPSLLLIVVSLLAIVRGQPFTNDYMNDYDYSYSSDADDATYRDDEQVVYQTPEFVSHPVNTMVNEGDTIKLPCVVEKNRWICVDVEEGRRLYRFWGQASEEVSAADEVGDGKERKHIGHLTGRTLRRRRILLRNLSTKTHRNQTQHQSQGRAKDSSEPEEWRFDCTGE